MPNVSTQTNMESPSDSIKLDIELEFISGESISSDKLDPRLLMPKESKVTYNSDLSINLVHFYRTIEELFKEKEIGIEAKLGLDLLNFHLWDNTRGYISASTSLNQLSNNGKVKLTLQNEMWYDKIKMFLISQEDSNGVSNLLVNQSELLDCFMQKFYPEPKNNPTNSAPFYRTLGAFPCYPTTPTRETVMDSQIIETAFLRCVLDLNCDLSKIDVDNVKGKASKVILGIDGSQEKFVVFKFSDEKLHKLNVNKDLGERYEIQDLGLIDCSNSNRNSDRSSDGPIWQRIEAFPFGCEFEQAAGGAENNLLAHRSWASNLVSGAVETVVPRVIIMPLTKFNMLVNSHFFSLPSDYHLEDNYFNEPPVYR